ncbi:Protein bric-a-brac 2 [Gryllus bimaculatus]|nr:Protein bric-a-brac 2 [Gryllus bimaculatus]
MQHCVGSPQQFCLRWNNYQSNLTNVFDQLLQSESFVDVTLACDGHSVKAHKMVLSACSPYFQSLFFDNPCQHPIVILKDIKWPELKAVVEFMYKGEINVSQEQIGPLLRVAESLKIRGLADVNGEQEGGGGREGGGGSSSNNSSATPSDSKKGWDARVAHDLSEAAMCPSPSPGQGGPNQQARLLDGMHRQKKRRRTSGERSSVSSPEESMAADALEAAAAAAAAARRAGPRTWALRRPRGPAPAGRDLRPRGRKLPPRPRPRSHGELAARRPEGGVPTPPQNHHGGPPPPAAAGPPGSHGGPASRCRRRGRGDDGGPDVGRAREPGATAAALAPCRGHRHQTWHRGDDTRGGAAMEMQILASGGRVYIVAGNLNF